ncbi:Arm DNA-binding domain-containing protein [Stenotrophomonas maltophilia]|uniref:Arm DNA-binding domain-containing protein n=1 Tax=Stenotrophomonas maltophilia TaxID=40324 RepID=UPI0013120C7F|nr:Arm DNA-binding domain-containing protein [Stenotrophomonas maltophilia]MBA0284734.1 DUF4102 domain-containing protein [Stenotrophomonas maltophilia]MBA0322731.1 DUF4102 domain-containing protein [Stenotrophomonas maltophilia]
MPPASCKLASGAVGFYYRYTGPNREQDRLSLGSTLSLAEARAQAGGLARRYQAGERDLRAALLADEAAATREVALAKATASARSAATLGALMNAYVSSLKETGKISAGNVEKAVALHIEKAWPALWDRPAAEIELDDLIPVLARLVRIKRLRAAAGGLCCGNPRETGCGCTRRSACGKPVPQPRPGPRHR